ncbi:MAG: hypothetical protein QM760_02365 [Nibricoccus sp.]
MLKDKRLAEDDTGFAEGQRATIPAFRTWYQRDDMERMFGKLYEGLGKDARKARKTPTNAQIDAVMDWNATHRGSWGDNDFESRLKAIDTNAALQGLGGNARVSYSTGMVRRHDEELVDAHEVQPRLHRASPTRRAREGRQLRAVPRQRVPERRGRDQGGGGSAPTSA